MDHLNRPKVVTWFKTYCWILVVIYLLTASFSAIFFFISPEKLEMEPLEAKITGVMLLLMGLLFMIAFLIPLFLKPKPWVWVYCIVMICIGFTSACFWPICIPLLIFWIKNDTKRYYGKSEVREFSE